MATIKERLARLESRIGMNEGVPRVIFVTGGDATEAELKTFLGSQGVYPARRDLVFRTVYETQPGIVEPPKPLRITAMTKLDGRPQAV